MNTVAVHLPMEEWNKVLSILAQGPWNVVNPLIMAMGEQLRVQGTEGMRPNPQPGTEGMRPNGADRNP